jgi:hypothetical protein
MSIARKLALMLALALAAAAVASTSAYATTVTPTGTYSGTETTPGTLVSDNGTVITCTSSDFTATINEDGTGNVTSLTFGGCTEPNLGLSCTVVVDTLGDGAALAATFVTGATSNWTLTSTFEAATITCALGTVVCEAQVDSTLGGTVGNATPGPFRVDGTDNVTIAAGSIACGSTASWTQSWDVNSPATYTITA